MNKNIPFFLLTVFLTATLVSLSFASSGPDIEEIRQAVFAGEALFQKGDFEHSIQSLEKVIKSPLARQYPVLYMDALVHLAHACKAIGHHKKALTVFNAALPVIKKSTEPGRKAVFYSNFADIQLTLGNLKKAVQYIKTALDKAESAGDRKIMAHVLNNAGNICVMDNNDKEAVEAYDKCLTLLNDADKNSGELKAKVLLNKAHAEYGNSQFAGMVKTLEDALQYIKNVPNAYARAETLVGVGVLLTRASNLQNADVPANLPETAFQCLEHARQIGDELKDNRLMSKTYGHLARLHESQGKYDEALKLTRSAVFFAHQHNYSEILYLWQWQLARILDAQGHTKQAVKACRQAINTLNPIRTELFRGYRGQKDTFDKQIKPVYLDLADLYLRQADKINDSEAKEEKLRQARDVMETLKTAEIQNFYTDECMAAMGKNSISLDRAPPDTAVIYPISLADRLVLLLSLPDALLHFNVPVKSRKLNKTTMRLRRRLTTRSTNRYLKFSRMLYNWLIRPIESQLTAHNINTLVIAPDGALRQIPFSALEDGEHFLIEKYAVGTIPSIRLTSYGYNKTEDAPILLSGLSESVQDFTALPAIEEELMDVKSIMNARSLLFNKDFTLSGLTGEIKATSYGIIHMATHGVFGGTGRDSFLLTYDNRLDMNDLEKMIRLGQFRDQKVELLTLSACQTALGNDRAALGLAGVAVKAGVRSAIATLWFVDDEATSLAIREFYRQLKLPGMTKAKALQNTQKKLIAQQRFQHPMYWAPFLLIGNWM